MSIDRLIKLPEVIHLTGKSKSSIYDDIKNGRFPNSIPIGIKARAWRQSDIKQWIDDMSKEPAL